MKNLNLQHSYWIIGSLLFILILAACALPFAGATTLAAVTNATPTALFKPTPAAVTNESQITAHDWSGYGVKGDSFTSVEATWQVPAVTCPASNARVSIWVGLDGFIDGNHGATIEQDGTDAICNGSTASYNAWWEMVVATSSKSGTFFTVAPGDIIFSSVYYINSEYALQVTDETSGKTSYSLQPCNAVCNHNSAEWIVEDPGVGKYPFANYSTLTFTGATAGTANITGGISAFHDVDIEMERQGVQMSVPTDLAAGSEGTMFTVTWHADQ